jgi:hypothetical protein
MTPVDTMYVGAARPGRGEWMRGSHALSYVDRAKDRVQAYWRRRRWRFAAAALGVVVIAPLAVLHAAVAVADLSTLRAEALAPGLCTVADVWEGADGR